MKWAPFALVVVLLACPVVPVIADPQPKDSSKEKPRTVEQLVEDLSHPAFSVREKAQRELWLRGDEAIPALEKAAKSDDPETVRRARELLGKFAWGIRPDTPVAALKLLRQYQTGDTQPERSDEIRKQAVTDLLKMGRTGSSIVRAILKKDLPIEAREKLTAAVTAIVRREVPLLLVAGKTEDADELISAHAAGTTPEGAADFAAYHALRGDLPAVIARCEAELKTGRRTADVKLVLTHLYRAAGEWEKARDAAAELTRPNPNLPTYKELLFEDEGNWAALADEPRSGEWNHPDAVRLTYLRLAGRKEKFDTEVKKVRADADELSAPVDTMNSAVALLSNHRADDATDLLLEKRKNLALLSEVLIARMRYKEALDLLPRERLKDEIPPAERLHFSLRRARVLMLAGQRDAAVQLFEEVARGLQGREDGYGRTFDALARALIRTELRVGLRDLACEHAAQYVPAGQDTPTYISRSGESPFEMLFPFDPIAAEVLFGVLREQGIPNDRPGATMIRVRNLLTSTASNADLDQALKVLREAAGATSSNNNRLLKARRYFALAQLSRIAKRDDVEDAFKTAAELTADTEEAANMSGARSWVYGAPDPARVWLEWGDYLTEAGRHRDAANVFEAGWRQFPDQQLPLFLSGQALIRAGNTKEGERRIELSHWVGLGSERVRGRFLDELIRRGEMKDVKREVTLILSGCWSRDHYFGNVMNQCSVGANLTREFATAEQCRQRSLLVVLRKPGVYFVDTLGYFNVPHEILVYRARGELAAGKFDDAMATARRILAITPGHLELVRGMVPELDSRNRKKEADELFNLAWGAYQKMLTDYPDSPAARHSLAVLAAHGQRKLDDGLKYAKAALASDPDSLQYREALAEVHFRRGGRADALKLMEKLAEEHPGNFLYRRQLARYRNAPFDSPWPSAASE